MKRWLLLLGCVAGAARGAYAQSDCGFDYENLDARADVNLVAVLHSAPRTKVTLSIDAANGFHRELVWDPAVGDGLRHDVLLPPNRYTILAYAEEDRVQNGSMVLTRSTQFTSCGTKSTQEGCKDRQADQGLLVSTQRTLVFTSAMPGTGSGSAMPHPIEHTETNDAWRPRIRVLCEPGASLEIGKVPLATKQLHAASVARGFLDQAAPKPVTDTLTILAEIAVERAKRGAMELVKERFVTPICNNLDLELLGLGDAGERAFPRACALLENMRLQDLLSSGRNLLEAARDDIRLTLVPRIVARMDIPVVAQEIAVLALDLGNKLLDGGGSEVSEIDLLLTQLDRMFRRGTMASFRGVNTAFINETFDRIERELGAVAYDRVKEQFLREVLQRVLPQDPGEWLSTHVAKTNVELQLASTLRLGDVTDDCKRPRDDERAFIAADRKRCINALIAHYRDLPGWGKTPELFASLYKVLPAEQLVGIVGSLAVEKSLVSFADWIEAYASNRTKANTLAALADATGAPDLLKRSCAVRVTLALVKWCSGRDTCTAADIAAAIDRPETLFRPAADAQTAAGALENMCWHETTVDGVRRNMLWMPVVRTPYVELATRARTFLVPPAKGEERKRIQAMLRWTFDLAKSLDAKRAASLQKLEEVLELFEQRDYVRAIGQTLALARCSDTLPSAGCTRSVEMKKAMELLGVVASYLQVYEETKTADPAEAKAARKKAIESLIDSATDRAERGREWIASIGSNVGIATSWTNEVNVDDAEHQRVYGIRVPLGLAYQYMPHESDDIWEGAPRELWNLWGVHLGVQLADLGQLINTQDDSDITWASFVAPGIELGLLFGRPNRLLSLTAHASYVPALSEEAAPVWRLGLAVSYYVPFFDLD